MIKKIGLSLILFCMILSCGKKGDPVYKNSEKILEPQIILINKV